MRWLLPVAAAAACAGPSPRSAAAPETDRANGATLWRASPEPATESPQPEPAPDRTLMSACPFFDAALGRAARSLAEGWSEQRPAADALEVEQRVRQEGGPYVWPHAWTLAGHGDLKALAGPRLEAWLGSFNDGGERRCGLSFLSRGGGQQVLAAVAVDALADLEAIPANVRVGSWVDVRAHLRVAFNGAKVVVLGPRGGPKAVPTSTKGTSVVARFAADAEGAWLVQVLAEVEHGPRPVLEALVIAGSGSRREGAQREAPGESLVAPGGDREAQLLQMLDAARTSEGLRPFQREKRLDQLARAQALVLRTARRVAHDLGTGDPEARASAAGLELKAVGENVAHGATVAAAHRALWSSPSHRSNILSAYFDSIGIGIASDEDGSVWVCELFGRFVDER